MTAEAKDTIYIDIDDEITAMINKLQASKTKVVALVLPKRATVLQSIVNMKLLKKAADNANKHLVLITSEAGLLPLAGAAGVYVAKNLQSKPEIPAGPNVPEEAEELVAAVPAAAAAEESVDKSKPVGELATKKSVAQPEETIEVDNDSDEPVAAGPKAAKKSKKGKKDGKNKIPNFERFRKRLFLIGGGIVLLLVFWFWAAFMAPKATITIKTDTTNVNTTVDFTASPSAQTVDTNKSVVPAKAATSEKADTQKAPTTGQKDVGTKATGTMTITNCAESDDFTIPGGSTFTANGKSFNSVQTITVPKAKFSSGSCTKAGVATVNVTAAENGDSYNIAATTYSSSALPDGVTAQGTAMSGGSSRIAKVVAQTDVDNAKSKMTSSDDAAKEQLKKNLQDSGYMAITETFTVKNAATTVSPEVGQEGGEVTVTAKGTYSMLGVKQDDLKQVVNKSTESEIDPDKQQIQNYGFDQATFKVDTTEDNGNVSLTMNSQVAIGPKIDEPQLKQEIAGKKRGDTETIIRGLPDVKEVTVKYSPFWVTKTPKKQAKITIILEKAN